MRKRLFASAIAAVLTIVGGVVATEVKASPEERYTGTHFGQGFLPVGCDEDTFSDPDNSNACYHMRTDMNGLDSPEIDVLIMVPASPTAERDMRIMRQAVEMWEGGIDYLAPQMGLDWLGEGVNFHITVDVVDTSGGNAGGEFTTYPIVDPEIVIVATNPVGVNGIGIDPVDDSGSFVDEVAEIFTGTDPQTREGVCHGLANPFDFEYWDSLPGFDHHHEERSGTYTEDCGGAGGNVCVAFNGGMDPAPNHFDKNDLGVIVYHGLFDLVAHEVGHCLSVGHVGDGAEGKWNKLPTNDIMAYNLDPKERTKCVSTLDVEGFATRASKYLDVDGDGHVTPADKLEANQAAWDSSGDPFQVQHPRDHFYASSTGDPLDCPQPDLNEIPGPRTDWTPEAKQEVDPVIELTSPTAHESSPGGSFRVTGNVARNDRGMVKYEDTHGFFDDDDDDAIADSTEILDVTVDVTTTHVDTTIALKDLPSPDTMNEAAYTLLINGHSFSSFVYPIGPPATFDDTAGAYVDDSFCTWDPSTNTVKFHIPRTYLDEVGVAAPYAVATETSLGSWPRVQPDDYAPEAGRSIPVKGASVIGLRDASPGANYDTVELKHEDANGTNRFYTEQSSAATSTTGTGEFVGVDNSHHYALDYAEPTDVSLTLTWTDGTGTSDLDLLVTPPDGFEPNEGATNGSALGAQPEEVSFTGLVGHLEVAVDPYLIADAIDGAVYKLVLVTRASSTTPPDGDGDGVADSADVCPRLAGDGADGCPIQTTERVLVYLDNATTPIDAQVVDTAATGTDVFDLTVTGVAPGAHTLRVEWEWWGDVIGTDSVKISVNNGKGPRARNTDHGNGGSGGKNAATPTVASPGEAVAAVVRRGLLRL